MSIAMSEPSKPFRVASIFWSIMVSIGVLALIGSILLPSTKRARFDFTQQPPHDAEEAAATPTTAPAN